MEGYRKPDPSARHSKIIISISVIEIIIIIVLLFYLMSPAISPLPSMRDTDGDGWTDSNDRFPNDKSEWNDSDHDGVGDNADIYDLGNGQIMLSIDYFKPDGTRKLWSSTGDPYFLIKVKISDPSGNYLEDGCVFIDTGELNVSWPILFNFDERQSTIKFEIEVWGYDSYYDNGTLIDYNPSWSDSNYNRSIEHIVQYPFVDSWTYDGADDGKDEEDCILSISMKLVG